MDLFVLYSIKRIPKKFIKDGRIELDGKIQYLGFLRFLKEERMGLVDPADIYS